MTIQPVATAQSIDVQVLDRKPWERAPGEPSLWYDRFLVYRDLGAIRSVNRAYKRHYASKNNSIEPRGNAYTQWYDASETYNWVERAALSDDWLREGADERTRELIREWREEATRDLRGVWMDLVDEWNRVTDQEMTKNQVSQAMKTTAKILNDTAPTGSFNVQYQVILDKLPPQLQKLLAESLE